MPIYAYRCQTCGFAKDVLQKMSDDALTTCPTCQNETFTKQLTAAGFQLKGSGWYATDFRGGQSAPGTEAATSGAGESTASVGAADVAPVASTTSAVTDTSGTT